MSSLNTEKAQLTKQRDELENKNKDAYENNSRINVLKNKIDDLTIQINRGRERHTTIKKT